MDFNPLPNNNKVLEASSEPANRSARIVFPHRIHRLGNTTAPGIQGDVAQTDLSTISANANVIAQHALGGTIDQTNAHTSSAAHLPQRANSSLSDTRGGGPSNVGGATKPRVSSAVGIFRARVAEGAKIGGGLQSPTAKLISPKAAGTYAPTTNWFNAQRYHPTNVTLNPLLQDKQLQELKEAMYAPSKKKASSDKLNENEGGGSGAFLTSTNLDGTPPTSTATAPAPPTSAKSKKKQSANTSLLNGKIGLRRLPTNDIAVNDLYAAHSISLKTPEAPFYGGALTSEVKKASPRATSTVELTTANIGTAAANSTKKKKGPTATLISNISAIHRGLAPYVNNSDSQIALKDLVRYLSTLVPPEYEATATTEYIRPFVRKIYDDLLRLQQMGSGIAVAGGAGAEAEEILNQTTTSATTETTSNAEAGDGTASTTGVRSHRAASRAGTIRAQSVIGGDIVGSRAASPSSTTVGRNVSPVAFSLGRTGGGANNPASQQSQQQLKVQQQRQEDAFFETTKMPYAHVIASFESLLKPSAPVSNVIPDDVSGAILSARICFLLCDPQRRGYITKEAIKAMRSDLTTTEDFNFNVVQGLVRGMAIVEKLEEERFVMLAKKQRKGKKSKKAPPMPTVRQFHISLDEFTHLLSSDAYIALAFLPYIIKTLMNGVRDSVAADPVTFYGKSQVAFQALQRANYREKIAAEANLRTNLTLETMTADEIQAAIAKREYPIVASPLAHAGNNDTLMHKSVRRSEDRNMSVTAAQSTLHSPKAHSTSRRPSNTTNPM